MIWENGIVATLTVRFESYSFSLLKEVVMLIECVKCGNVTEYSELKCQCPNDIIKETGWVQDEDGNWICDECQKEVV